MRGSLAEQFARPCGDSISSFGTVWLRGGPFQGSRSWLLLWYHLSLFVMLVHGRGDAGKKDVSHRFRRISDQGRQGRHLFGGEGGKNVPFNHFLAGGAADAEPDPVKVHPAEM